MSRFGPDIDLYIQTLEAARKADAVRAKEIEAARETLSTTKNSDGVKHYRPGLLGSLQDLLLEKIYGAFPANWF